MKLQKQRREPPRDSDYRSVAGKLYCIPPANNAKLVLEV
jgi:hypothetical protein